jgi:hypothetical protein
MSAADFSNSHNLGLAEFRGALEREGKTDLVRAADRVASWVD